MFNPEKDDYPQNAAGQPEFASIILHIDPVLAQQGGDDVTQKLVLSTQPVLEALTRITSAFGEPDLLARPAHVSLLAESGRQENPVFVYTTPRQGTVLILTSTPVWDMLVQHPDFGNSSSLLASEKIQELTAQVQGQLSEMAGGFSPILLLDLSPDKFEAQDEGGGEDDEPNAAESLSRTADMEEV